MTRGAILSNNGSYRIGRGQGNGSLFSTPREIQSVTTNEAKYMALTVNEIVIPVKGFAEYEVSVSL